MFGTSLKWAWKAKATQSLLPKEEVEPTQNLLPSVGHLKALHWSLWSPGALSEQQLHEQTPQVLRQAGEGFQGFVLPEKKCWYLGTFKFGICAPCLFYKPIKQAEKGQAKMVRCCLPFFSFSFFSLGHGWLVSGLPLCWHTLIFPHLTSFFTLLFYCCFSPILTYVEHELYRFLEWHFQPRMSQQARNG